MNTIPSKGKQQRSPDYKNSDEGRKTAERYADIIHLSRPVSTRPRMDLVQRAKIFTPYDALRGFDEAIDAVNEKTDQVPKVELSDGQQADLSDKLLQVHKGMELQVQYFSAERIDGKTVYGRYIAVTGLVNSVDPISRSLSLQVVNIASPDSGAQDKRHINNFSGDPSCSAVMSSFTDSSLADHSPAEGGKIEKDLPLTISFDDLFDITSPEFRDIDEFLDID